MRAIFVLPPDPEEPLPPMPPPLKLPGLNFFPFCITGENGPDPYIKNMSSRLTGKESRLNERFCRMVRGARLAAYCAFV
jgi:hypothetical protein